MKKIWRSNKVLKSEVYDVKLILSHVDEDVKRRKIRERNDKKEKIEKLKRRRRIENEEKKTIVHI